MRKLVATVTGCVLATLLTACESLSALGGSVTGGSATTPTAQTHIADLDRLASATYQERIDLFQQIDDAYSRDPSDENELRLALARSVDGHPASDRRRALSEITALLGRANSLSPTQMRLARLTQRDIEQRMIIESELTDLRSRVDAARQSSNTRSSRTDRQLQRTENRLRDLEAENLRLSEELKLVRQQLDAILTIETASPPATRE